jgi:hypothetical protein
MEARVRVPPPSIPKTTFIVRLLLAGWHYQLIVWDEEGANHENGVAERTTAGDKYMLLADCQDWVSAASKDQEAWKRMSIL